MDDCTHQPTTANPEPAYPSPSPAPVPVPVPAPPAAAPQEATGDSESDTPAVSALTVEDCPSVPGYDDEDDAESCSGAGGGYDVRAASVDDDDGDRDEDGVATEGDENEVDSRMAVPWWHRMQVQDAADGAGGGCAWPQAAVEDGAAGHASHAAESNRLFWEACIAHGY